MALLKSKGTGEGATVVQVLGEKRRIGPLKSCTVLVFVGLTLMLSNNGCLRETVDSMLTQSVVSESLE